MYQMTRSIVQIGDPVLRAAAKEIPLSEIGSERIRGIIADMKTLLAKEELGVAIAAPQVGESVRLFVVAGKTLIKRKRTKKKIEGETDLDEEYLEGVPMEDEVYINPVLVKTSRGSKVKHEGCLSIRGKWGEVPRAEKATVRAFNERGEKFERGASGFLAHIFQHEMDHLDGVLYVDKATDVYDESEKKIDSDGDED
jgi:peptide deformylase